MMTPSTLVLWLAACGAPDCPDGQGAIADGTCVDLAGSGGADAPGSDGGDDSGSGSGSDSADTGGADTGAGDTGDTGEAASCPEEGQSDAEAFAEMTCEKFQRPCNHQVRIAIGGGEDWSVVESPVVLHASVPDALLVPRVDLDGDWHQIWIAYVDALPDNAGDPDFSQISVASLLIEASQMADADALSEALAGEGPCAWRYNRTNSQSLGSNLIDPGLEAIYDAEGQLWYYLVAIDNLQKESGLDPDEVSMDPYYLKLARGLDGANFEALPDLMELPLREDGTRPGVDPDLFPLGLGADTPYPGALGPGWGPGGGEAWGLHLARSSSLAGFDGDLDVGFEGYGAIVTESLSVATTSRIGGEFYTYGHTPTDPEDLNAPFDVRRISRSDDGVYGEAEVVLESAVTPLAELGALSPTALEVPGEAGLQLLVFHTPIDPPEDWD